MNGNSVVFETLKEINKQYINVFDLVNLIAQCEQCTEQQASIFLLSNEVNLEQFLPLMMVNKHYLQVYTAKNNQQWHSPIALLKHFAELKQNRSTSEFIDNDHDVGFSKYHILSYLYDLGLNIMQEDLIESKPFLLNIEQFRQLEPKYAEAHFNMMMNYCQSKPQITNIDDNDNDLNNTAEKPKLEYLELLNQFMPLIPERLALILRVYYHIYYLGNYRGERGKREKIVMFLEQYEPSIKDKSLVTNKGFIEFASTTIQSPVDYILEETKTDKQVTEYDKEVQGMFKGGGMKALIKHFKPQKNKEKVT